MNYYEHIVTQTIQLFPQLFLGKHGLLRESQKLMKPSDKTSKPQHSWPNLIRSET